VIILLIGPILVGAMVTLAVRAQRKITPLWRESGHDGAWCLMKLASEWVRDETVGWSSAMQAEFAVVEGRWPRWQFALGCLRAALTPRRHLAVALTYADAPGRPMVGAGALVGALAACSALEVYGQVHYRAGAGRDGYTVGFVLFLAIGAWMAWRCTRSPSVEVARARRYGTGGGLATGALFLVAVTPLSHAVFAAVLAVGCAVVATTLASRASGDSRTGFRAGLLVAVVSGLVFFIGVMTMSYAAAGWFTRDPETVAVFNHFRPATEHGHQLAQWPGFAAFLVRRASAAALLFGFVVLPILAVASGAAGGLIGGRRRQELAGDPR
jgi:hypothetical protein